jgi:dynein heavy chain 2
MSLVSVLDRIKDEFASRSGAALLDQALGGDQALPFNVNFSKVLHQIVWAKSLNGKVKKILAIAQMLLSDLKK